MNQVEQDQREMSELRERFADVQHQHLSAESELIKVRGEMGELQTKHDAALLKLEQRDISHERMAADLDNAHAEIEQWKVMRLHLRHFPTPCLTYVLPHADGTHSVRTVCDRSTDGNSSNQAKGGIQSRRSPVRAGKPPGTCTPHPTLS